MACALAMVTFAACTTPAHEPEPIDDWETGDAPRPQARGNLDGSGEEQGQTGDNQVSPTQPVPDDHEALELVRDWVRAETTAYRGGNRDRVRRLASPDCEPCEQSLDRIAEVYANGGQLREGFSQNIAFIQGVTGTNPPVVQAILEVSEQVRLDADGGVRKRIPASTRILEFRTAKEGGRWLITDIISAGR